MRFQNDMLSMVLQRKGDYFWTKKLKKTSLFLHCRLVAGDKGK